MNNKQQLDKCFSACSQLLSNATGKAFIELLEAQIEEWKEDLVNSPLEKAGELQGAIRHVRDVLDELKNNRSK